MNYLKKSKFSLDVLTIIIVSLMRIREGAMRVFVLNAKSLLTLIAFNTCEPLQI